MAASLSINAMQVNFESVLGMEHAGMVRMFKSLEETGLKGFLEVSGSVYDGVVIEFFVNAKVIVGKIVSFVANRKLVIMKDVFAEAFGISSKGMAPNKKKEMKIEYRLLHDIVAKDLAILKVNWAHDLFQTLVAMVHMPTRQSQGFSMQLSVLLEKVFKADLGESVKLHPLKAVEKKPVEKEAETKKKKEKAVVVVKKPVVVVENPSVAVSQAAPEKSTSGTSLYEDTRPLSKLGAVKKDAAASKCKLLADSPDSDSTIGCELDSEMYYFVESELVGVGSNCELVCFELLFGVASSCYATNEHGAGPLTLVYVRIVPAVSLMRELGSRAIVLHLVVSEAVG
ncbi:hypothetical protein F511_12293 [Dorcoceras hygrometricum]|uniref:Uncharacterized protein n=1 Tax=Dorcoceras hygrometricum TaxID=472368 RepID=A0A2Z7BZV9_9LAMI|nr:hypothetical protein F511_12293 [Dorcoceras hygrometricum]